MNLVINSKFRPFTYDEMVKPLIQYKEAYDKVEQDYSNLTAQTEMWKDIVNRTNSPEAYEMYQRYSNDLAAITEDFSRGMNINNRRALIGMKRRYSQDIEPIARASEAMNAANEFRAKAGQDAIFEVGEYNSLDPFLHGQTANNKYQSREALIKKTAAITEATMAEVFKDPEFKKVMGDQLWMITQHTGGSYEELMEAMKVGMMDNPIAQNMFSQIRQKVARDSDIQNYGAAGQQAIMEAIDTGLYVGLDKPVRSFQANQDHLNPLQAQAYNQSSQEFEWKKEARKPLPLGDKNYFDPITRLTFTEDDKGNRTYNLASKAGSNPGESDTTGSGDSSTGTARVNRSTGIISVTTTGKSVGATEQLDEIPTGAILKSYKDLLSEDKKQADIILSGDSKDAYDWYIVDNRGNKFGDSDRHLIRVPREVKVIDITGSETNEPDSTETEPDIKEGLKEGKNG